MTEQQINTDRQRELIAKLSKLAVSRADALTEHREDHEQRGSSLTSQHDEVIKQLSEEYNQERSRLESEYADALSRVETIYSAESKSAKRMFDEATTKVDEEAELAISAAKQKWINVSFFTAL